jgi:hypothetical protein
VQRVRACAVAAVLLASSAVVGAGEAPAGADLAAVLQRVGEQVEHYYASARTILCTETVHLQPLGFDWTPRGFARRIVDELRVEWDPDANDDAGRAQVRRRLLSINGRPPAKADANPDEACMDPQQVSPEPLEFLLPSRRDDYSFKLAGTGHIDGRTVMKVDYRPIRSKPPSIVWTGDCVSVDVPSRERGQVWVDPASGDVLRLDQHLDGSFEFPVPPKKQHPGAPIWMEIERADSSIRYAPVTFHDPDETLVLPVSIDSLQVVRNAGVPRLRTWQQFSDYRRFLTSGKLVKPPVPPS